MLYYFVLLLCELKIFRFFVRERAGSIESAFIQGLALKCSCASCRLWFAVLFAARGSSPSYVIEKSIDFVEYLLPRCGEYF